MIVEEHVRAFINSLNAEEESFIASLEQKAHENHVPIIREEMREYLRLLVTMTKPQKILEIGTAIGYSAIIMHEKQPSGVTITTIERNEKRYGQAIVNIRAAGYEDAIQCILVMR